MKKLLKNVGVWIFIAMAVGVVVGSIMGPSSSMFKPLGDLFIQLIKMLVVPLVVISIISGAATLGETKSAGLVGGLSIGYICPEAAECGPIALLENGDVIEVELAENRIHACVSDEEFARRAEGWKPHIQPGVTGFLARYANTVGSSRTGAIVK